MPHLLRAGVAKQEITPPIGTELCGYVARIGPSTEVHDRLWAKSLVVQHGKLKVALLFLDLLGLNPVRVQQLKLHIQQKTGIEHVMVICSHTHAGPATEILNGCGETKPQYMEHLLQQMVLTVTEANRQLVPVAMKHVSGEPEKLSLLTRNRRRPGGPVDPVLNALLFQDIGADRPLAVFFRYTCHPVVLDHNNQGISNDWVGYACQHIESSLDGEALALFANGPAGNINPAHRGTLDFAQRMGQAVGEETLSLLNASTTEPSTGGIAFTTHAAALNLLPVFDRVELEQLHQAYATKVEELQASEGEHNLRAIKSLRVFADWSANALDLKREDGVPEPVTVEVQALRLGEVVLLALPGEVFVEYGLALRKEFGEHIIPIGYANGNPGYTPWNDAYAEGGYEVDTAYKYYGYPSCIAPEGGENLLSAARRVILGVQRD